MNDMRPGPPEYHHLTRKARLLFTALPGSRLLSIVVSRSKRAFGSPRATRFTFPANNGAFSLGISCGLPSLRVPAAFPLLFFISLWPGSLLTARHLLD